MYTIAPAWPSWRAIPFPIPREAPVTSATFPLSDILIEDVVSSYG